jgi:hypothetical protein
MQLSKEPERAVETVMLVKYAHKSVEELYQEGNIPYDADTINMLHEVGMPLMISTYCEPGKNFNNDFFENKMQQYVSIKTLPCRKVLMVLNKWRACTLQEMTTYCTPQSCNTPLSSNIPLDSDHYDGNDTYGIFQDEL